MYGSKVKHSSFSSSLQLPPHLMFGSKVNNFLGLPIQEREWVDLTLRSCQDSILSALTYSHAVSTYDGTLHSGGIIRTTNRGIHRQSLIFLSIFKSTF